jgi:spore coat polysaccharide biosynthesis predicted glycosyltransferase SpsG
MIIFRTDASVKTGFGHLKRSSYLASLLRSKTAVLFCLGSLKDKTVTRYLEEKKWSYCSLKQANRLEDPGVKGIIFDLRYFADDDLRLIERARARQWVTVQITDLGLSQQEVDYTIDASVEPMFPYGEQKQVLSGPAYAILHTRFRHFHRVKRKYRRQIRTVFICLGGAVEYRNLRRMIDLLSRQGFHLKIAPGFYLKKSAQKILRRIYPGIRFVGKTESLARSFFEADAALITTGVATFEAAAVGTPALYFYYHDEQRWIARVLENRGVGLEISNIADLGTVTVVDKIKELTLEKRIDMGSKGKQLVDAGGVYRIMDFLERHHIL